MNFSRLFIERPVTTTLIMIGIAFFGVMAYRALPVSDLPNVDFPTIQVTAGLPGANPETMASAVALPLEKQFATIAGVTSINSTSFPGTTSITVQFDLARNIDAAAQDVQSMIAKAARQLPPQMPSPPSLQKVNPADQPVLILGINSAAIPMSVVYEYAQTIAQRISMVSGVAQVGFAGDQKYAVRIDVDPRQLAAHGLGIDEVARAVVGANANVPTGTLYGARTTFTVQADGQLLAASEYAPTVIAYHQGRPVRLEQVAHVYDGVENDKMAGWDQTGDAPLTRSMVLTIQKQPGTNTVAVVDGVKQLLPTFRAQLPAAVTLTVRGDRSETIHASVNDVKFTLLLTVCLVVLVIFLFLRNISATIIPSLALPVSILATFAVMYQLSYSLDNLSLMALTLSVGFIVDDAIVMLENIVRHMEMGKSEMAAAFDGSREVAFTILSMTLSLAAVFIPMLFMGGMIGRLLHEFAVTIGVAILVSGFVSISLTPMLCSRFLTSPHARAHGRLYRSSERVFDGALHAYDWSLRICLRFRAATMLVSVLLIVATGYLFVRIPKGFLPSEDISRFQISTEAEQGITYDDMVHRMFELEAVLRTERDIASADALVGFANRPLNQGSIPVFMKPRSERAFSVDQVIARLRPKIAGVMGLRIFMTNPPIVNVGSMQTRSVYQFTLQDTDTASLYRAAPILEERLRRLPGLEDVTSDLQVRNPQINVKLNRDRIAALGLSVDQVETAMSYAYGARQVSTIYAPNNQYQVIMQVGPEFQMDASALAMLHVRTPAGTLVPLKTIATLETGVGPLAVNHVGQLPSVTLSFNLRPGAALGDAIGQVQNAAAEALPATISTSFQGAAQMFRDSLTGLGVILLMALAVIYLVLGILYESFTQPLTILSGLPSAGLGALLTLLIFKTDLNLYAFVGVIMLLGLVKKNGIMMVDFAITAQRLEGKSPADAIREACLVRFRPIMMTTMAALVGTLPIAIGYGVGAESRRPLGLAVVGGLLVSQLLTLYITPVYYVYIEGAHASLSGRRRSVTVASDIAHVQRLQAKSPTRLHRA